MVMKKMFDALVRECKELYCSWREELKSVQCLVAIGLGEIVQRRDEYYNMLDVIPDVCSVVV